MQNETDLYRTSIENAAGMVIFHVVDPADESNIEHLTSVERQAARRLRIAADRAAYVASHMLMRSGFAILGYSFACKLETTPLGRPFIDGMPFHFSLSRTRGLVACAFSAAGPLGLDIEDRTRLGDLDDLIAVMMTPAEQDRLAAMTHGLKADTVLKTWTRKEAMLKAIGTGLSIAPDTFSVDVDTLKVEGLAGSWRFVERWLSHDVHCTLATCTNDLLVRFHEIGRFPVPNGM